MPTKKERLVELERKAEEEGQRITELENKVAELENKMKDVWLIPSTQPITVPSVWHGTAKCWACGQYYLPGVGHVCPGTFGQIKITCTSASNGNIVSNGVTYHYKTLEPEKKEGV